MSDFDRTPPHDIAAEQYALGGALLSQRALEDVTDLLTTRDFYRPAHGLILDAAARLHAKGEPSDAVAVADALTRTGDIARIGGAPYLHELIATVTTSANAAYYARIVREKAVFRRLVEAGTRVAQLGYAADGVDETVHQAQAEIDAVAAASDRPDELAPVGADIDATLDELENPTPGIQTPWPDLNHFIRGWKPGRLYVVGARPAVGKSIVALQAAVHACQHGAVLFHSLEMSKSDIDHRLIALLGEVALGRLEGRTEDPDTHLTQRDWTNIAKARAILADLPLYVDNRFTVGIPEIRARARAIARRQPLAAIVVDYLQLIDPPRHMQNRNRAEVVAYFSRSLKALAKEFNVPVIVPVQLNRGSMNRADPRPNMADIRESGAVEQDADVILLLHTASKMSPDLDLIVEKNRQGTEGIVELEKQGHYARALPRPWRPKAAAPPAHHQYADN